MASEIVIQFKNRDQSIKFSKAVGMPHTVAALEEAEARDRQQKAFEFAYVGLDLLGQELEAGRVHLRDCNGELITGLGDWLAAVEAGRWPVLATSNELTPAA